MDETLQVTVLSVVLAGHIKHFHWFVFKIHNQCLPLFGHRRWYSLAQGFCNSKQVLGNLLTDSSEMFSLVIGGVNGNTMVMVPVTVEL